MWPMAMTTQNFLVDELIIWRNSIDSTNNNVYPAVCGHANTEIIIRFSLCQAYYSQTANNIHPLRMSKNGKVKAVQSA